MQREKTKSKQAQMLMMNKRNDKGKVLYDNETKKGFYVCMKNKSRKTKTTRKRKNNCHYK